MTDAGAHRLVVHSGTFKTGTSAIQLYLARAEHHGVLARAGVAYPALGRTLGVQHANLVAELRGDRTFSPAHGGWDALLASVVSGGASTTIVSSESFSRLTREQVADLGDRCRRAGVPVTWVHYVRDQPGFHNAFYVERMLGIRGDLAEIVQQPFEEFARWSPIDLGFLDYATYADHVEEGVEDVRLVLRPFGRGHLVGGDAVQDFCHVLELPLDASYAATTNVGVGWRTVETSRRLFPVVREFNVAAHLPRSPMRALARERWLQLIRSELVAATTAAGWNDESAVYLTESHRSRLLEDHHEANVRLDARVDFPWLEIVGAATTGPYNVGDFRDVSADELFTVLSRVLSTVHEMPAEIRDMVATSEPGPAARPASLSGRIAEAVRRVRG